MVLWKKGNVVNLCPRLCHKLILPGIRPLMVNVINKVPINNLSANGSKKDPAREA